MNTSEEKLSERDIEQRRDDAIRRALNTSPNPTKKAIGKTERAQAQGESRVSKGSRFKPKGDAVFS